MPLDLELIAREPAALDLQPVAAPALSLEPVDRSARKRELEAQKEAAGNPALDTTLGLAEAVNAPIWEVPGKVAEAMGSPLAEGLKKAPSTVRKTLVTPLVGEGQTGFGAFLGDAARKILGPTAGGRIAGAAEAVGDTAAGLTSPLNLLAAGTASGGGAGAKAASTYFAAEGARGVPESVEQLRAAQTPEEQGRAAVGLGANALMAAGGVAGALHSGEAGMPSPRPSPTGEGVVPVPESRATLAAQLEAVNDGRRPAMLITPGEPMPAELPPGLQTHAVPDKGTYIYNPAKTSPGKIIMAVKEGRDGDLLGMGAGAKPSDAEAVLQTKNAAGIPVTDEVVSRETLPAAIEAARKQAPDGTVELKPAEQVIRERVAAAQDEAPMRQLGEKVLESDQIDPDVKRAVTRYTYDPLPNETVADVATRVIGEHGLENAASIWRDEKQPMAGAVRTALGQAIVRDMSRDVASAKGAGNGLALEQAIDRQARFIDEHLSRSTDVAQALQAFKIFALATPEGLVRHARGVVDQAHGPAAWTPKVRRTMTARANDILAKPEGFQRDRATVEFLNELQRLKGHQWYELPLGIFYSNILSGPFTHAKNLLGNIYNLGAFTALETLRRPRDTMALIDGLARGVMKGGREAAAIVAQGKQGAKSGKFEPSNRVELAGKWATPWKVVGRSLAAEDAIFFRSAEEMRSAIVARKIARQTGLHGEALSKRVDQLLGRVPEKVAAAKEQAKAEGLKGNDFHRRVSELMEQQRPQELREDARQFALRATFNQKPEGLLGAATGAFNHFAEQVPAVRLIVPFTNIIANVVNESLNYTPAGMYRGVRATLTGKLMGREVMSDEIFQTHAKAVVGTLGMAALAMKAAEQLTQTNPSFAVYGAGPTTPEQRHQLQQTGWRPYSLKLGNEFVNYQQTPLAVPMAVLGNYMDALRWRKLSQANALERVAVAGVLAGKVFTDQSWLDGLAGVFKAMDRDQTAGGADAAIKQAIRTGSSFAVPNVLRQIDQLFDPTIYDQPTIQAMLVQQVPFVRRQGKPALNALGEPVLNERSRQFVSPAQVDDVWKLLADKQAWIPVPKREETIVGDRKRGPDAFRPLDQNEFYEFIQESGERIRQKLELKQYRIELMEPERARRFVRDIADEERANVKRRFRN